MANFDVRRIVVDQGSFINIMYSQLFKTLLLDDSHLTLCVGSDLQGFNGTTTKPWGYIELLITFGEAKIARDEGTQLNLYQQAAQPVSKPVHEEQKPLPHVGSVNLDARFTKDELKKQGEDSRPPAEPVHPVRPISDTDFELILLGDDPDRGVKIGTGLPDLERKQLKACLRQNADFFAWSVAQRRRRQSPEKVEAAERAIKYLLEANFISEPRYSTCLTKVVLVKKSMCDDYTDLNRACPKDAYPLPNIDRLVDNSADYKLLSFMDAYSGYNQVPMAKSIKQCKTFMTESGNYYYNIMPFNLKNVGATYQRMMNKVFHREIRDTLEVYMDDMIVKSRRQLSRLREIAANLFHVKWTQLALQFQALQHVNILHHYPKLLFA
ncbi:uncharacterized protein LOC131640994 [Vicia villosa]|uniref:uncharacterized protein LOC131640994 n=1 Tax=Vicia villosa TaxID=3911 RepID=UPI00273BAADC|nr:uncharacterized protein LOC131640994 [Vicia villosa]